MGEALAKIFGQQITEEGTTVPGGQTTTTGGSTTTTGATTTTAPSTTTTLPVTTTSTAAGTSTTLPSDAAGLIALANQHYQAAIEAEKRGDWATYGAEIQALGQVLDALQAAN